MQLVNTFNRFLHFNISSICFYIVIEFCFFSPVFNLRTVAYFYFSKMKLKLWRYRTANQTLETPTAGHQFDVPPVDESLLVAGLAADGDVLRFEEGDLAAYLLGSTRLGHVGLDAQQLWICCQRLPQGRLVAAPAGGTNGCRNGCEWSPLSWCPLHNTSPVLETLTWACRHSCASVWWGSGPPQRHTSPSVSSREGGGPSAL